jgi:hypothetical protein
MSSEKQEFDPSQAHQARMYDYLLGGKDWYPADQAAADAWIKLDPESMFTLRQNRAFLGRAVRYLAGEAGIRQFLDIGTGIPTAGNVHEIAQGIEPASRVVYVDYDPVVLAHARALLTSNEAGATDYIDADFRDTETILAQAAKLLDFAQPVAITMVALLHAIPDADDPHALVARLLGAVPSGSYLALTHLASDLLEPQAKKDMENIAKQSMRQQIQFRDREQVARFFDGTDLVDPGLVRVEQWRPDGTADDGHKSYLWSAVARKR